MDAGFLLTLAEAGRQSKGASDQIRSMLHIIHRFRGPVTHPHVRQEHAATMGSCCPLTLRRGGRRRGWAGGGRFENEPSHEDCFANKDFFRNHTWAVDWSFVDGFVASSVGAGPPEPWPGEREVRCL